MKIKKMTAVFGSLDNAVLTPGDGLTVITAPNEGGKSTWAGFWRAMLYGIDTRERDKAGSLADKNRFQPWSGAPMRGEVELEWQGKDITIRRFPAKNNPFGGFEAVYTATGDPVPGLTAANVGEPLTGASREVYLRSAFVGQGGAAISPSGELEARIAALATAGQEDVSYSDAERTLKDWRNRRRANRANGLIPELQGELSETEQTISAMARARSQIDAAGDELVRLERERAQLSQDAEIWERLERHALNRRYGEAQAQLAEAKAKLAAMTPPDPEMADWTAQEARDWADAEDAQYRQALDTRRRALERRNAQEEKSKKSCRTALILALALVAAAALLGVLIGLKILPLNPNFCLYLLIGAAAGLLAYNQARLRAHQALEAMEIPEEPESGDWQEQARRHADYLAARQRAEDELRHLQNRVADLKAQGAREFDTLEYLEPPARSKADTKLRLEAVEGELSRCRDGLSRAEGALQQMGGPDELEARRNQLQSELAGRTEEYDALSDAMDALSAANDALRQRFSPALNQAAGELFAALTGGKYQKLSLARDFSAQAAAGDSPLPHTALALSTGTAEQLYLAVRLALCRLTLPDAPIWLDDALAAFDEERMALALGLLRDLGKERQILLFSCHRREGDWAAAHGVPALTLS